MRVLMGYLPQNNRDQAPKMKTDDRPDRLIPALNSIIPGNAQLAYDMKSIIRKVCLSACLPLCA